MDDGSGYDRDEGREKIKERILKVLLTLGGIVVSALLVIALTFIITPQGTIRGFFLFFAGAIGLSIFAGTRKTAIGKLVTLVVGAILLILIFGFYMSGGLRGISF